MNDVRSNLAILLLALADTVGELSQQQYENLMAGKARLVYKETRSKGQPKPIHTDEKAEEYLQFIVACESREAANDYLAKLKLSKTILTQIASRVQIHILKSDNRDQITQKIIEAVVGTKLRSDAIKHTDLSRRE